MPRLRKPDALSGAERQRRFVESHQLVTIRVRPEVHHALNAERVRSKRSVDQVLPAALSREVEREEAAEAGRVHKGPAAVTPPVPQGRLASD